jgi:hypothetical protein
VTHPRAAAACHHAKLAFALRIAADHGQTECGDGGFTTWTAQLANDAKERCLVSSDHLQQMTSDQVPAACKTADSFFAGFWDGMGWGFGVAVKTEGPQRGRIGWSGGQMSVAAWTG